MKVLSEMKALLDGKIVDAALIDARLHRYLGMWRSPTMLLDEGSEKHGYVIGPNGISAYCPTCRMHYGYSAHQHQLNGCWDMPQYASVSDKQFGPSEG